LNQKFFQPIKKILITFIIQRAQFPLTSLLSSKSLRKRKKAASAKGLTLKYAIVSGEEWGV